MNQFPSKNFFTLPNEIFSLGLGAGEIAVYAYLRCLENPSTYQCWPSYTTIGNAVGRAKNTVMQYVDALSEKGLISTEPTSVLTKSGIKKNGNLRYTIRPIRLLFIPCLPAESHANNMPRLAKSMRGRREKSDCASHSPVFSCL